MNKTQTSLERQTGTYFISCIPDDCKRKWQIALKTEVAKWSGRKETPEDHLPSTKSCNLTCTIVKDGKSSSYCWEKLGTPCKWALQLPQLLISAHTCSDYMALQRRIREVKKTMCRLCKFTHHRSGWKLKELKRAPPQAQSTSHSWWATTQHAMHP